MNLKELYKKASSLPLLPGCYIMRNAKGEIIYIGKAKRLKLRVQSYFRDGADHQPKVAKMVSLVGDFDVIVTDSEFEALVLECSLIKQNMPKYNILLKDDKGFSYIRVSLEEYPRITAELQKNDDGAAYYGPYMGSFGVKRMVETAVLAFKLPTCGRRFPNEFGKGRPCLNAHIGRCMALCSGTISREEYLDSINGAITLLTKGTKEIVRKLNADMIEASEKLEFERAARIRDSIAAINKMEDGQKVIKRSSDEDMDVFAFAANERSVCAVVLKFREGKLSDKDEQVISETVNIDEAREEFVSHYYINSRDIPQKVLLDKQFESDELVARWLTDRKGRNVAVTVPQRGDNHALVAMAYNNASERLKRDAGRKTREEASMGELANLLGLETAPKYIEAYDISNYGEEAVAGMVVFENGFAKRSDYKRFIIKSVSGVDDYASMTEAVLRRVNRYEQGSKGFTKKPDIILLDGGKGHLSTIWQALEGTPFEDVPIFGMVKDTKHRTRGIVSVNGELDVKMHKAAFTAVSRIQDEVHRFTIDYQRGRHSKGSLKSFLEDIPGIGAKRAKNLMKQFKSTDGIKRATQEQLAAVPAMSEVSAKAVYNYFHGGN